LGEAIRMSLPITVLMSVYNGEPFLAETIQSILTQSLTDFEFLIIDDASTDNSMDIIRSFKDKRIRLVQQDTNQGIANSLNHGLSLAQGNYIAVIDQDDIALPMRLSVSKAALDDNPNLGLVGTSFRFIDENSKLLPPIDWPVNEDHIDFLMQFGNPVCHPSCMYRKSIALQAGGYSIEDGLAADYGLTYRISRISRVANIGQELTFWRLHGNNASRRHRQLQLDTAQVIAQRAMCDLLGYPPKSNSALSLFEMLNVSPFPLEIEQGTEV
jgi:glycosyltransferase involved in cell wall biosynthesis